MEPAKVYAKEAWEYIWEQYTGLKAEALPVALISFFENCQKDAFEAGKDAMQLEQETAEPQDYPY